MYAPPQENRREYEKRVACIVEQSWLVFTDDTDPKEDLKPEWRHHLNRRQRHRGYNAALTDI